MSEETKEVVVEVPAEEVVVNDDSFDTEGLLPEEISMAKEYGLIKEEEKKSGEHDESEELKTEDNTEEVGEKDEGEQEKEIDDDTDSFEDIDEVFNKDEKKFHEKFSSNQKALYFKNKAEKKKRQEAQKTADEYRAKYELDSVKTLVATKKLEKIKEALGRTDLTVEQLQEIIDSEYSQQTEKKLYTKEELEAEKEIEQESSKKEQSALNERILLAEQIGKSKNKDFDALIKHAEEVFKLIPAKQKIFRTMLLNPNDYDENEIADFVIESAKLSKNYNQGTPEQKLNADRAIKNSKKKVSSASIGASKKSEKVTESELTVDSATRLSVEEWSKLSENTKKRIMMGLDPE